MQMQKMDMWTWGNGEGGMNWEIRIDIYTAMCKIGSKQEVTVKPRELSAVIRDDLEGWDGRGSKREKIYVYMRHLLLCVAETNTTL